MQVFLGFINFYYRFICSFLNIAHPLFNNTGNNTTWTWGLKQEYAFAILKTAITTVPVLASPDISILFRIKADSLDFATSTVLSQQSKKDNK